MRKNIFINDKILFIEKGKKFVERMYLMTDEKIYYCAKIGGS
jgi:hypothetical protein